MKKLDLDRDFTRFLNDRTFPYKVTACIGDERILCSGVLLAQQSSILEKKFREDDGMLIFEEMIEVEKSSHVLLDCVKFLHGADLLFTHENIELVLKFASWYKVKCLTERAVNWVKNYYKSKADVGNILRLIKISYQLEDDESVKLKEAVLSIFHSFGSSFKYNGNCPVVKDTLTGLRGTDVAALTRREPFKNSSSLFQDWVSISIDNKRFVLENGTLFDFQLIYKDELEFANFVALLYVEKDLMKPTMVKLLLEIQKKYLLKTSKPGTISTAKAGVSNSSCQFKATVQGSATNLNSVQVNGSSSKIPGNTAAAKNPGKPVLDSKQKALAGVKKPMTLVAYKKPDLVNHSSQQRSSSSKKAPGTKAVTKGGQVTSNLEQKPLERPISGTATAGTKAWKIPEIVDPNFEQRLHTLKQEMASLEVQSSKDSSVKDAPYKRAWSGTGTSRNSNKNSQLSSFSQINFHFHEHESYNDHYYDSYDYCDCDYDCSCDDEYSSDEYEDNSVWVGNVPKTAEVEDLNSIFGRFGKIDHITIRSTDHPFDFAFIDFRSSGSAQALLRARYEETFTLEGIELLVAERH